MFLCLRLYRDFHYLNRLTSSFGGRKFCLAKVTTELIEKIFISFECLKNIRPDTTFINAWVQWAVHAVAIDGSWSRFPITAQLHINLNSKYFTAVKILTGLFLKQVSDLMSLMRGTRCLASCRGWPGTCAETSTEAVLSLVTFIVVRKVSGERK